MALVGKLKATSMYNAYCEDIDNVYYKIVGVFIDTEKEKVRVPVRGYLSEYARHNQGIGVFKRVFYIPIEYFKDTLCESDALIKKSYEYISELPEFEGCKNTLRAYKGNIDITKEQVKKEKDELDLLIMKLGGTGETPLPETPKD